MNPFDLPIETFEMLVLIFIRMMAILMALPVIGSRNVPMMAKIGLSLAMSMMILPTMDKEILSVPRSALPLMLGICGEVAIGLFIGFLASLVFAGIQLAGQFIGYQMGFGIVSVLDPQTSSQLSIIAVFQNFFALLLFLSLNMHHLLLRTMLESFTLIPLLSSHYPITLMKLLVQNSGVLFVLAIKIGAPIMAVLLFTNVSMGAIARTVPQMNVFIVSFPLQIGVGLIVLGMSLPLTVELYKRTFIMLGHDVRMVLRMMVAG